MNEKNVVYGINALGLILIPEERAQELAGVFEALTTAETWGEFRGMISKKAYEEYLVVSEHYQGPRTSEDIDLSPHYIPDDTPFTPNDVFFFDNPPGHPEIEMSSWVPREIQKKYGRHIQYYAMDGNVPAGSILELDESQLDDIIEDMEALGYNCLESNELIEAAYGSSFDPDEYPDRTDIDEED